MAKHKLMTREIKRHNYAGSNGGTNPLFPNLYANLVNEHLNKYQRYICYIQLFSAIFMTENGTILPFRIDLA